MSTSGAHPAPEELDVLLEADSPDVPASERARLAAHVESCGPCRDTVDGMAGVRALLRAEAAHVPEPPADLDARIAAALAAAPAAAPTTVVPLRRERPRVPRWAAVAAGLLVLGGAALTASQTLGGGGALVTAGSGGGDEAAESSAAEAGALPAAPVLATGTDYDPEGLGEQVGRLVEQAPGAATLSATERDGGAAAEERPGTVDAQRSAEPLAIPQGLAGCLEALGATGAVPLAVDLATWRGRDVAVIVLDEGESRAVWVVERTCAPGADGLVHYQSVTR
ncbi:MAG: anti-sigma factor family protein [Actinomycetes bacterium]